MQNLLALDLEVDIPIGLIDPHKKNPKIPIHGVYRRGLEESLDFFGMRDRLKVRPTKKGRFECINGNQRVDIILEKLVDNEIKISFTLDQDCSKSELKLVKENSANASKIKQIRKQVSAWKVPCQVISQLNENEPFTAEHAELFIATYDRNHAKVDEPKQADLYRSYVANSITNIVEERRKAFESRIKSMVRPELPTLVPRVKESPAQEEFQFAKPGEFTPTDEAPWGPSPPVPSASPSDSSPQREGSSVAPQEYVAAVFSFTKAGYEEIMDSIMRSKSRVYREHRVKSALEKLEKLTNNVDSTIDDTIVETALLILNKRIESAESNGQ